MRTKLYCSSLGNLAFWTLAILASLRRQKPPIVFSILVPFVLAILQLLLQLSNGLQSQFELPLRRQTLNSLTLVLESYDCALKRSFVLFQSFYLSAQLLQLSRGLW